MMHRIISPTIRGGPYLSAGEVAKRHNTTADHIRALCRVGCIWPATKVGRGWIIDHLYTIGFPVNGRPATWTPSGRGRGRPPGSKNKKPYPKGVKRPRKPKEDNHDT